MICTFLGHRDTPSSIQPYLLALLRNLIEKEGASRFFVGNQGAFDHMATGILRQLKREYSHICFTIVLAYLPTKQKTSYVADCDTLFPEELETSPPRFAIDKRNHWLINRADTVITYVVRSGGNAARFKKLAEKRGKRVINLPDSMDALF